jgi:hypothetical protein
MVYGVTWIVAVTGDVLLLVAVKLLILPVPEAARPMEDVVFVQRKLVPGVVEVKERGPVTLPLQTVTLAGTVTTGTGLTITLAVFVVVPQALVTLRLVV